jgi:hypothetical protein
MSEILAAQSPIENNFGNINHLFVIPATAEGGNPGAQGFEQLL